MEYKIRTRKANILDAASMSIIHADSWKKAYKGLLPDEYLNEIQDTQWVNMITKGLEDSTMNAWVATIKDTIIACICVGNSRHKGYEGQLELISIYVLPEYWNLGVGSLLIEKVLEYAMDNEYKEVGLWVLDGNNQAIRFYEKKGFFNNGDTISCMIGKSSTIEKRLQGQREKLFALQFLLHTTGITTTAGIGTNLYLTKTANDFKQIT